MDFARIACSNTNEVEDSVSKIVNMLSFRGRLKRLPFFRYNLFIVLLFFVGFAITFAIGFVVPKFALWAMIFFVFVLSIAGLAIQVRRFHDMGRSGWWVLCPLLVGIACAGIYIIQFGWADFIRAEDYSKAPVLGYVSGGVGLIYALVLLFWPGTENINKFDDDYFGEDDDAEFLTETQLKVLALKNEANNNDQTEDKSAAKETAIATPIKKPNKPSKLVFKAVLTGPMDRNQLVLIKALKEDNDFIENLFVPKTLDRIDITVLPNDKIQSKLDAKMFFARHDFKVKYVE